jgi:hypothetical protein
MACELGIVPLLWGALGMALGQAPGARVEDVVIRPEDVVCERFLGFGAQWDSEADLAFGVTDEDFAVIAKRVRWMRLPVARIMMLTKWCCFEGGRFDWETPEMKALYRHLDLCQELNTTVLLTDWGGEKNWTRAPGVKGTDDPHYAEIVGAYMDYLLNTKKYACIRYFILTNEPNWEVGDWGKWKRGVENVAKVLAQRGLDKRVVFTGSDTSQSADNESWHRMAVDQLPQVFGAYDVHRYADGGPVRAGELEAYLRAHWDYARQHDPNGKQKPCIVGEAGMNDDAKHPFGNPHIGEYAYGVFMADYAVQAARAGSAAVSTWMLDDNGHKDFFWGLWDNKANGMKLRAWFYAWSLLTRFFPANSILYRPPQVSNDVRVLAARIPRKAGAQGWTFCIVNRAREPLAVTLRVPDGPAGEVHRYVYSEREAPADADGFPTPAASQSVDWAKGLPVACPGNAVMVCTP